MQTPKQIRWGSSGAAYERYLERQQSEYSIQVTENVFVAFSSLKRFPK